MKKLKNKLMYILSILTFILVLSGAFVVKAAQEQSLFLNLVSMRSGGYGYKQSIDKVWKIAKYESKNGKIADLNDTIYCIKAGPGFGSTDMGTGGLPRITEYSKCFDIKDKASITSPYVDVLPKEGNYNSLIWLLDNFYIMPKVGVDNTNARIEFLKRIIPETMYEYVTDDDIDVIQQLAIWHFTNPEGKYFIEIPNLTVNSKKNEDKDYVAIADLPEYKGTYIGWDREEALDALFKYYVDNATKQQNYISPNVIQKPVELQKNNAKMNKIGTNYIAGPYTINQLLNVNYKLEASYTDLNDNIITPILAEKNINGEIIKTDKTLNDLVGKEFYLMMPISSNISGIKAKIKSTYTTRTAEFWSVVEAPLTEQPVVRIIEKPHDFVDELSIAVPKPFDLSLRKFITAINGKIVEETREPVVDVKNLASGEFTTAIYNHRKNPLPVEIGDIVEYTIRVYNEGEVDGYVEEITDHLPPQLEFIADDTVNIDNGWKIDSSSNIKTIRTNKLSKASETSEGSNLIKAFDGINLSFKDVKIKCKVILTEVMPTKITNLADITKFTDGEGNQVIDRDSQENNIKIPEDLPGYKDPEINRGEEYIPGQQDDDDFEKVKIKEFDLALRKFITQVNNDKIENRIPKVDFTNLKNATSTTATYNHTKVPVPLAIGDTVIYTIRVYNEGEVDGYVEEITDHLPPQLEFLSNNEINKKYEWQVDANNNKIIRTKYLSKAQETIDGGNKIIAFNGKEIKYKDVQVACKVILTNPMPKKITNIADITDFTDSKGNKVTDRDSKENNLNMPEDLPGYKDEEIGKDYIPGQEDDDDFEKVTLKEFDLALRKFITKINEQKITSRIPEVDITNLKNGTSTTAKYNHSKKPIKVSVGDIVEYTIRVYNEGEIDGYAEKLTDHLPEQLEFVENDETNIKYGWKVDKDNKKIITTDYLSKMKEQTADANKILAFDGTTLAYKDVKVVCKVILTNPMPKKITNIADISDFTDGKGNDIPDRDSKENNVNIPEDLPGYKDPEINKDYVPGQEDDDDFEKLEIARFDLALRKFITAVNTTEITSRIPQVDVTDLVNGTSTTAKYNHSKEPVLVSNGNIVTYTIRVFNEGELAGYAKEVKDDIPEGLEYLPDHELNKEYRWVMLDEQGNETKDIKLAKVIKTDYLSKEQEKVPGENLIKEFNKEKQELSYKDVKVAFKVIEPNTSDRIIINKAQISKDSGENGQEVEDCDSEEDKWNEGEDDQDIEKIKVQYFDLSLRKWVTQAIVTMNGKTKVIETGHKAEDDPEEVVKVDLKKSDISKVSVKFRYKIRVKNEGKIAGYAKELKDYIPEGLRFDEKDNPLWKKIDDRTIVTDQTKDILLKPGDTTEVEVILTWINDKENFGVMDNWAEISKDKNDFESPDIDSVPDNNKKGEDDIDDAPVIITVKTGEIIGYTAITMTILLILSSGIYLIKKYVL